MIYAVDFDGTLFQSGTLDENMLSRIRELRASGDKVFIHTSRQGNALNAAREVLQDIELDGIVGGKFFADYYVDDRNMTVADFLRTEEERKLTPSNRTKFKDERQIRALQPFIPPVNKRIESDHYVEGYAARFEPYVLFDDPDGPIYERFERGCFDGCDMTDIIFQLNHEGTVMARLSNQSLIVEPDETGLFVAADLGRTEAARRLYEEISAGMITKMSWGFILGDYEYDRDSRTIIHKRVKKIFDVSAVSIPANQNTEINARSWADGVIDLAARSEAALEERRRKLRLKIKLQEGLNYEND